MTEGFFCDFVLRRHVLLKFQTSPSKIQKSSKITEITMMITRCRPRVNDKRQPIPTTFIDKLFKIGRGRGLVRRSSENDYFLQ
jgi:hypothetical protein